MQVNLIATLKFEHTFLPESLERLCAFFDRTHMFDPTQENAKRVQKS